MKADIKLKINRWETFAYELSQIFMRHTNTPICNLLKRVGIFIYCKKQLYEMKLAL